MVDESKILGGQKRSCWFYDNQKTDRLTCVSLHTNTYRAADGSWVQYKPNTPGIDAGGYSLVPLCTSILNEDFQVSIANTWTQTGGEEVGQLWDSFSKPLAPYTQFVKDAVSKIGKKAAEFKSQNSDKKSVTNVIATGLAKLGELTDKLPISTALDYMNAKLISQGTRFTYYNGTGVSFGNLQMRFTLFPEWTKEGHFYGVQQQLEELFPYVIGEYKPFVIDIKYKDKTKKEIDQHASQATELLGWQMSPAGYRANFKDIDVAGMRGTLKLRIGAGYILESLVCNSLNFTLSKQMVKKPEPVSYVGTDRADLKGLEHILSPLFADVVMSFEGATKFSDRAIRNFIYGLNLSRAGNAYNEGADEVDTEMKRQLTNIKETLYNSYPTNRGETL